MATSTIPQPVPASGAAEDPDKLPFDIHSVMERVEKAVEPFPKAALFELAERGYRTPFEQLVACILSIRTRDEVTLPVSLELFAAARTPAEMLRLAPEEIDAHIGRVTFHEAKARQIREIARRVVNDHGGELPCDREVLLGFHGVGVKCAHLTLGIACGQAYVSSDIHVHRVTNRWGYLNTKSPEETTRVLEAQLPGEYCIAINRLLVPFGKHICTGQLPKCSTCPVLRWCRQVGVDRHR